MSDEATQMSEDATHSPSQSDRRLVATVCVTDAQGRQRSADEVYEELAAALARNQQARDGEQR